MSTLGPSCSGRDARLRTLGPSRRPVAIPAFWGRVADELVVVQLSTSTSVSGLKTMTSPESERQSCAMSTFTSDSDHLGLGPVSRIDAAAATADAPSPSPTNRRTHQHLYEKDQELIDRARPQPTPRPQTRFAGTRVLEHLTEHRGADVRLLHPLARRCSKRSDPGSATRRWRPTWSRPSSRDSGDLPTHRRDDATSWTNGQKRVGGRLYRGAGHEPPTRGLHT